MDKGACPTCEYASVMEELCYDREPPTLFFETH